MKRTQIDTDWISVGELTHRAAGLKIFLSPIMTPVPPGPPGLTRRLGDMSDPLLHQRDQSLFGVPHQPVPIRSLRTSTLESYINGNSQSASPSSSAGPGSHVFGNPEPPLNTVGANRRPYIDAPIDSLSRSPFPSTTTTYGFNGKFLPFAGGASLNHSSKMFIAKTFLGTICNRQSPASYLTPALCLINIAVVLAHTNQISAFLRAPLWSRVPFCLRPLQCNYSKIKITRTTSNPLLHPLPICPHTVTLLLLHLGEHQIQL